MNLNISDSIRYIGADDVALRKFENQYPTPRGMSYNSYVILDDKILVADTIDSRCFNDWKERLHFVLDGRKPDYLLVHHMEPDHSFGIEYVMERYPDTQIIISRAGAAMLPRFCHGKTYEGQVRIVTDGDELCLGHHHLHFVTAPMVHWPEVIMSYESTEKIMFTADAFGKFGANQYADDWIEEARRYYCNIVAKYGIQVQNLLKKIAPLDIRIIAPLHGPVLREDLAAKIGLYDTWSSYRPEREGVLVAYASIYGGTAEYARLLATELRERGMEVYSSDLCADDQSEAVAQAFRMSKMVVAAPSYDSGLYPPMYDFLHHLEIKGYRNRTVAVVENGSWAPTAGRVMTAMLQAMKDITLIAPMVTIKSRMQPADLPAMQDLVTSLLQ